jgi:SnoaL-like protein
MAFRGHEGSRNDFRSSARAGGLIMALARKACAMIASTSSGSRFQSNFGVADVVLGGKKMPMTLRITEVFRFEQGSWKLVHRHGDMPERERA